MDRGDGSLCVSASMSGIPEPGSNPNWELKDIFSADPASIYRIKLGLAKALEVRYATICPTKPLACDLDGITALSQATLEAAVKAKKATLSTVVNICNISWNHANVNPGYVEHWAREHMDKWDSSIERRAGGYDSGADVFHQELAVTNVHSFMALVGTAVAAFMRGELDKRPVEACSGVRVLLFTTASVAEIALFNSSENVEQHERKRYTELDNILTVRGWMQTLTNMGSVDPKALDVFKFAVTLRHESKLRRTRAFRPAGR